MPHITNEIVTEKRKAIKALFPTWKFSITKHHHSSLHVVILEADIQLMNEQEIAEQRGNVSVNHHYIHENYADRPEVMKALQDIADVMLEGKKEVSYDGDYGSIPNFYVNLRIGEWDKPFKYVKPEPKIQKLERIVQVIEKAEVVAGKVEVIDYSEKAIAVVGDTKPIKETLKDLGGKFNRFLKCGAGWIFPKTKEQAVREKLGLNV